MLVLAGVVSWVAPAPGQEPGEEAGSRPAAGARGGGHADRWISGTAARVNDDVITEAEVWNEIRTAAVGLPPDRRRELYERKLLSMIVGRLLDQATAKLQLTFDRTHLRTRIEAEKERRGGEAAFRQWLRESGMTEEEHVANLLEQSRRSFYLRSFAGGGPGLGRNLRPEHNIEPTVREIRDYYREKRDTLYTVSRSATVRYMAVRLSNHDFDRDRTLAEARRLRQELLTGADFETLARRHASEADAVTGRPVVVGGGRKEAIPVPPEVEEYAFSGEPGTPSKPLPYPRGFFIVLVDSRRPARTLPFAEVQADIQERLRDRNLTRAILAVRRKLLEDSYIYPPVYKRRLLAQTRSAR